MKVMKRFVMLRSHRQYERRHVTAKAEHMLMKEINFLFSNLSYTIILFQMFDWKESTVLLLNMSVSDCATGYRPTSPKEDEPRSWFLILKRWYSLTCDLFSLGCI